MDSQYINRAQDWIKWYMYHRQSMKNAPIEKQVEFLQKANHGLMEMLARTVDQLIEIEEGRDKVHLVLPDGVVFHEPIETK